jgi:hypothetical protein
MVNFSSLCISMDTFITAICSNKGPQLIFYQIHLNFVAKVNNPDWVRWSDNVGSMPLLHWYCYSFLEQVFNCFVDFTTDFGNGNIMTKACSITELNTSALKSALTVLKTFLLSNQPPPGYHDRYYGHAWFSFRLQCQSLE